MVYQWITLAGAGICLALSVVAWRARPKPGATPLVLLLSAIGFWNLAQFFATVATTVTWSIVWARLHYVGLALVPPAIFAVVVEYVGHEDLLNRWTIGLLLVEPVVVNVLLWTSGSHDLFVHYVAADRPAATASPLRELGVTGVVPADPGPVFWLHAMYAWGLAFVSLLLVCWLAVRRRDIYREQLLLLGAAIVVPLIGSVLDNLGVAPIRLTELCFVFSGVVLTVAVSEFDLVDLTPVARATVLTELSSGIVVIDNDGRIIDTNPRARRLLDIDEDVIGTPAAAALDHLPDLYGRYESMRDGEETISVETPIGTRHYRIRVSPLSDRRDRFLGRVFLVDDVTDQQERQAELERQNEQLDRFASVVSHDLRNPLQVANGHVQLAHDADDDTEHLEQIAQSHERMETIIQDVLTMARQGQTIEQASPTDLHAVARAAWETVETPDAIFENDLSGVVESDEGRLQQVFENLFRNSVDHAGPEVTVHAGMLETEPDSVVNPPDCGFFVEDDGPGIPADRRDDVFESGYTDSDTGTGLGLSIVESIAEAHGWTIDLTESEIGGVPASDASGDSTAEHGESAGVRFEITGVDVHDAGLENRETDEQAPEVDSSD